MSKNKFWLLFHLVFLFALAPSAAGTQTQAWWESIPLREEPQRKAGLGGGEGFQYVHALTYAPSDPSVVYFSTDTSQVWKSSDSGLSWQSVNDGFAAHGARSLGVDPFNPDIVLAAGFLGIHSDRAHKHTRRHQGIYRTTNGGQSWTFVRKTDFYKQASKGCLIAFDSSSFDGRRTTTVFAGSYSEGLLRSTDGGDSWHSAGFRGHRIIDMKEDPRSPGGLFVSTEQGLYTYEKGKTTKIGKGLPDWPRSVAVAPANEGVVYAAVGRHGVFKSQDRGRRFFPANMALPPNTDFTDIAVSPANADIVYLKAHLSSLKPFFSHDGATSWHLAKSTNLGNLIVNEGFWFSSPFAPHPEEPLIALTVSNGRARILKTQDGGKTWAYAGNGFTGGRMRDMSFASSGDMVLALTDHGLWVTEDSGSTFRQLDTGRVFGQQSSCSVAMKNATIVASLGTWTKKALIVSQDHGKTWKTFNQLVAPYHFIAFHPAFSNVIYAGPYRSSDSGLTWERLPHAVRSMYPANGDLVYAISPNGKDRCLLLKSSDRGDTWTEAYPSSPFGCPSVIDVAAAPDDPDRIYVGTTSGFWFFDGHGWVHRNARNGLEEDLFELCQVGPIAVDPDYPNAIYVGRRAPGRGQSNGVFLSLDRGLTWMNATFNLGPELTVWSVEMSPVDHSVYIGTSLGTFRLRESTSLLQTGSLKSPAVRTSN